jgi:hypothetical protein
VADLHGNKIVGEHPSTAGTAHNPSAPRPEACGPQRLRLSRKAGWRKPECAVVVSRPGKFGNPFTLEWAREGNPDLTDREARILAVKVFHAWLIDDGYAATFRSTWLDGRRAWILEHLHELAGKDLCCWCPLPGDGEDDWCHARVLLELARVPDGAQ